jgi:hypothetical protein
MTIETVSCVPEGQLVSSGPYTHTRRNRTGTVARVLTEPFEPFRRGGESENRIIARADAWSAVQITQASSQ